MTMLNLAAWGVDPKQLEELQRITKHIRSEIRGGKGRWEGRFQVILSVPDGDPEAQRLVPQLVERFTREIAEQLYVAFAMKGERVYVT